MFDRFSPAEPLSIDLLHEGCYVLFQLGGNNKMNSHQIPTVPLKDPLGSFLSDLASVCGLPDAIAGPNPSEIAECLRNVREKLLVVHVPDHRVTESLVTLNQMRALASPEARGAIVEIMDRIASLY